MGLKNSHKASTHLSNISNPMLLFEALYQAKSENCPKQENPYNL